MGKLSQRHPPLEELIDMVRFVVRHVLGLEVHVEMREFGMGSLAMPVGGRQRFEPLAERRALSQEFRKHVLRSDVRSTW